MAHRGEAALDLPFPLAHDNVVFVVAYHTRGHELFLPRTICLLVPGCAESLAQLFDYIRIYFLARKQLAYCISVVGRDDQFSSLSKPVYEFPESIILECCGRGFVDLIRSFL